MGKSLFLPITWLQESVFRPLKQTTNRAHPSSCQHLSATVLALFPLSVSADQHHGEYENNVPNLSVFLSLKILYQIHFRFHRLITASCCHVFAVFCSTLHMLSCYSCSDLSNFLHTAGASWHRTHSNKAPLEAKSVKTSVSLQKHTLNCTKCGKHFFFYITEFVSAKSRSIE